MSGEENKVYKLLIEPIIKTEPSRIFGVIKLKGILQGDSCKIKLRITNFGDDDLPGASIKNITINHTSEKVKTTVGDIRLGALPAGGRTDIPVGACTLYGVRSTSIDCKVLVDGSGSIEHYQKSKVDGTVANIGGVWKDFFLVGSKEAAVSHKLAEIILFASFLTILVSFFTVKYAVNDAQSDEQWQEEQLMLLEDIKDNTSASSTEIDLP